MSDQNELRFLPSEGFEPGSEELEVLHIAVTFDKGQSRMIESVYAALLAADTRFASSIALAARLAERLKLGREQYGVFSVERDPRDFIDESTEELLDAMIYRACEVLRIRKRVAKMVEK